MPTKIEKDSHSGVDTTGHDWDGVRELDNPLPKWWLYTWLACIAWALVYVMLYPSIPYGVGYWHGALGFSSRSQVDADVKKVAQQRAGVMDRIATQSFTQIRAQPALLEAAQVAGKIGFANNCQPCHGAGGAGAPGYPALAAGSWIWGGKAEDIETTLIHGIRSADPDARNSAMPHFGADGVLTKPEIELVADHVMTLYGKPSKGVSDKDAAAGAALFAANCAACHGETGRGNREVGAPALTSHVHLYGEDRAEVVAQITNPRMGVMPNWGGKLDTATIKALAIYIHDLGGGE